MTEQAANIIHLSINFIQSCVIINSLHKLELIFFYIVHKLFLL